MYSDGRRDACANCGSTLSAVGMFPQLQLVLCRPLEYSIQQHLVLCRPSECFRSCSQYFVGRQSTPSNSILYSVGRRSISTVVASPMSAVRVLRPVAEAFCRPSRCFCKRKRYFVGRQSADLINKKVNEQKEYTQKIVKLFFLFFSIFISTIARDI